MGTKIERTPIIFEREFRLIKMPVPQFSHDAKRMYSPQIATPTNAKIPTSPSYFVEKKINIIPIATAM